MNETMHIHDETAAYALNALPPAEVAAVEAHAAHCSPCRSALHADADAAQMLALLATPQPPPQRCKHQLLERLEREAFLTRPTRRSVPRLGVWIPVTTLIMLLAVWNVANVRRLGRLEAELDQARTAQAELQATLERSLDTQALVMQAEANRQLKAEGNIAPAATAKMYMSPGDKNGVVTIMNLPPPPPGKMYRIWVERDGETQACGILEDGGTLKQVVVKAPEALSSYKSVMITLEDRTSSTDHPSEQTVLRGEF